MAAALTFLLTACGGEEPTSAKEISPEQSSSSSLYDASGNVQDGPADRRIDTGLTADYRDVIGKIGLDANDGVSTQNGRVHTFSNVDGTDCTFVLTLLSEGSDSHYVASLRTNDGGFPLDEEYLESEESFRTALDNSGC